MVKICTKCHAEKPLEGFGKKTTGKDGLMAYCKACDAARCKAWREANKEKVAASYKAWQKANKERYDARRREWARRNPEKQAARCAKHRAGNPEKYTAYAAKRRAAKLQRTPPWLTQEHHDQIISKYEERGRLTQETGIEHHVDHIVPLQGDTVSGLHVPWNLQVITATENQQKSNSY